MRASCLSAIVCLSCLLATAPAVAQDAPEISRSRGKPGSVLVLWPRIVPGSERARSQAQAAAVQERLRRMVRRVFQGMEPEVRPRPERVCPRGGGCKAVSVGALLIRRQGGCAVVALVSAPGESAARLVPWAGSVVKKRDHAEFRTPPENQIKVKDFAACDALEQALTERDSNVEKALRYAFVSTQGVFKEPRKP